MARRTTRHASPQTRDRMRYRWIVLGVATATQAAAAFFVSGIGAISVHLQRSLDLTTAQLGLLVTAAQLVPLAGLLVAGGLLDRYGERWVVAIGAGVVAVALAAGSLSPGYAGLLVALLVVGAGYSTIQPGGSRSVASWFASSRRGVAMGIRQAGLPLGAALASSLLPLVAVRYGWRATLLTGAIVATVGAGLFACAYRRPPAPRSTAGGMAAQVRDRPRTVRRSTLTVILSGTSLISVQYGVSILAVLHLHDTCSLGTEQAALVLLASQVAGAAGRICLAAWSDRSTRGRHAIVWLCMIAVIIGLAVLTTPAGHEPVVAAGTVVWLGFFGFGWYGPWVAHVAETAPPHRTGLTLGLAMSANQIAVVTVPPGLGLLVDLTGSYTPVWASLSLLVVVALALSVGLQRRAS
ncbi:MFS transporter [Actinocatenispora rupis]|uniref:MFS transporter n=1 Tax=Actinocatenispora rupis TaxID=519421 RepID=A0A8J3J854_9ACTN|nr:MFS transporter [Actinocatenispora rupis]GID10143.1 MFS transporter [Actinocatenispora rupis]